MVDTQVQREELPSLSAAIQPAVKCTEEYKPSRQECLRDYSINIRFLSIGCVIEVGCKLIPFSTIDEGMKALNEYVNNPYEQRKIWEEKFKQEENQ